jgi:ribonuclease Z
MPPSFHPRTVNGPFDDPGLFIGFLYEKRALLFDLGNLGALSPKEILKVSHVFVSHTHMDHFIGFDQLLRIHLGREKTLFLYGPEGFLKNVEGKLAGYSWNLVQKYTYPLVLQATEVRADRMVSRRYRCSEGFSPEKETISCITDGILLREPSFSISFALLDHKIPCIAFCLSEMFHVNIDKNRLESMGLAVGPWLNGFKKAIYDGKDLHSDFEAPSCDSEKKTRIFKLGDLAEQLAIVTPGQKIAYVTDSIYSEENREKIVLLAKGADHLFIESCFLEKHREVAREKYHLTAAQAGLIAREADVKKVSVFHFSPRYAGQEHLLEQEAMEVWKGA